MRHVEIGDDELGMPVAEIGEGRLALAGGPHLIPLTRQDRPQHARDLRFVVDDQDP